MTNEKKALSTIVIGKIGLNGGRKYVEICESKEEFSSGNTGSYDGWGYNYLNIEAKSEKEVKNIVADLKNQGWKEVYSFSTTSDSYRKEVER